MLKNKKTKMNLISKNFLKTLSGLGFCFIASLLSSTNKVSANACPTNPSSSYFNSNGSCYITLMPTKLLFMRWAYVLLIL